MDDNINKYINQNNKKIITKKIDNSRKINNINYDEDNISKKIIFNENIEINVKNENILYDSKIFKNFSTVNRYKTKIYYKNYYS